MCIGMAFSTRDVGGAELNSQSQMSTSVLEPSRKRRYQSQTPILKIDDSPGGQSISIPVLSARPRRRYQLPRPPAVSNADISLKSQFYGSKSRLQVSRKGQSAKVDGRKSSSPPHLIKSHPHAHLLFLPPPCTLLILSFKARAPLDRISSGLP